MGKFAAPEVFEIVGKRLGFIFCLKRKNPRQTTARLTGKLEGT